MTQAAHHSQKTENTENSDHSGHKAAPAGSHAKDLLLLFAVPLAILVVAGAAVYIPRLLAQPAYDFVYAACEDYDCRDSYSVGGSGEITRTADPEAYATRSAVLRYYDAKKDATRSLTLDEARRFQLDTSSKSPDGYSLSKENSDGGFLFWSDYRDGWVLKNGAKKKPVDLVQNDSYGSSSVTFLGWVRQ